VLLDWFDLNGRRLPWRSTNGERADPYRVWLSEIMLQQTRVAAVVPYYREFTSRWPSIHALAAASLDDVLRAWAGLGYYARARNLHRCARLVVGELGGKFPTTVEGLVQLPGIGSYTAGAIAAIAFDRPVAAVDGNVERVLARLFAFDGPLPRARPAIGRLAASLVPRSRAGDFAQALMDLGAQVCLPAEPKCQICPWADRCAAWSLGAARQYPRKTPKATLPTRYGSAFLAERQDGAVLLRRRPENGLLGGMMEVPTSGWSRSRRQGAKAAPFPADWQRLPASVEHTFTHFRLVLSLYRSRIAAGRTVPLPKRARWVAPADLDHEALPSLMRKILAAGLSRRRVLLGRRAPAAAGCRSE
jgi:A/G-specific adenine glycosylase